MIIDIPYTYVIKGLQGRKRNEDEFPMRDVMAVEIVEVSADDAPVVVELESLDSQNVNRQIVEYRFIDGELYRQAVRYSQEAKGDIKLSAEQLVKDLAERHIVHDGFRVFEGRGSWAWGQANEPGSIELRTVSSSDQELWQWKTAQAARDLRLVDGMVFRKSREPVMTLEWEGPRYGWFFKQHMEPVEYDGKGYVRLDLMADYIDFHEEIGQPKEEMDALRAKLPVVHYPEALKYDAPLNELRFSVNRYMANWDSRLKNGSKDLLMAYVDIRDAIRGLQNGELTLDEVIPTLEESLDASERSNEMPETVSRIRAQIAAYRETRTDDMALAFTP